MRKMYGMFMDASSFDPKCLSNWNIASLTDDVSLTVMLSGTNMSTQQAFLCGGAWVQSERILGLQSLQYIAREPCSCSEGTYLVEKSTDKSRKLCKVCPSGKYQDSNGYAGSSCHDCAPGRYSHYGICRQCPEGRFSDTPGLKTVQQCSKCPRGEWSTGGQTFESCNFVALLYYYTQLIFSSTTHIFVVVVVLV